MRGLLAERHRPLLAALAANEDELLLEVDVREVQPDRLGAPQPRGVDELEQGAVAQGELPVAGENGEQRVDLGRLRCLGKPLRLARGERRLGDSRGAEGEAQERSDRRDAPRDRRGCELRPPPSELGHVVREHAHVDRVETGVAALEPPREVTQVEAVGPPRGRREPR